MMILTRVFDSAYSHLPSENGIICKQSKENNKKAADEQTNKKSNSVFKRPPKKSENLKKKKKTKKEKLAVISMINTRPFRHSIQISNLKGKT